MMKKLAFGTLVVVFALLGAPMAAQAQPSQAIFVPNEGSCWSVNVQMTPRWESMTALERFLDDDVNLSGQEVRVGIGRGRTLGGDWGVDFVWARISSGSSIRSTSTYSFCQGQNCAEVANTGDQYYFTNASLMGLEVHKYLPFATVNERIQFGLNLGGGVLWPMGTVENRFVRPQVTIRKDGGFDLRVKTEVTALATREVFRDRIGIPVLPTGRLEGVVGIIATGRLKIKVASGINFPSQHIMAVGATWLF